MRCLPKLVSPSHKLLILANEPRPEDEFSGEPFSSGAGQVLRQALSAANVSVEECCVVYTNSLTPWQDTINSYKPDCILALGAEVFKLINYDHSLHLARGSVFPTPFGCPAVGAYDPLDVCKIWTDMPYFRNDVKKACIVAKIAHRGEPVFRPRTTVIRPTYEQAVVYLTRLIEQRVPASFDIEGYPDNVGVTMIGFSTDPGEAFVIPFFIDNKNYWEEYEECEIWRLLAHYLSDPTIPKTAHNAFYECFVMAWRHRLVIKGLNDDTMMLFWELYVELEKALDVVASFVSIHPFWKGDRESEDTDTKLQYNATDNYITEEARRTLTPVLQKNPRQYEHYRFNISLIPPVAYLNIRGCRFDVNRAAEHAKETISRLEAYQELLHYQLAQQGLLDRFGGEFNVKSPKQKSELLYDCLGVPESKRDGRTADESKLIEVYARTRNPLIRTIIRTVRLRTRISDIEKLTYDFDGRIRSAIGLVSTNTGRTSSRASYAMSLVYEDSKKYGRHPTGWENTGTNLQNVTKELRDLFIPDPGYEFWQLDLAGADGWTVAADLANLGYPAMLEDYLAGIKPAKVLMLLLAEYEAGRDPAVLNGLTRSELKTRCSNLVIPDEPDALGRPGDWRYMVCKKTQHGSNYDAKPDTVANLVFDDSDGLVDLTPREAGIYQYLYKLRYRPELRNQRIKELLTAQSGVLHTAMGISRKFYALRTKVPDDKLVREASALEPQANTTGTCNMALLRLWNDPENRLPSGRLRAEPLLQIHDALAGQYPTADRAACHRIITRAFANLPLRVGKTTITIPADGGYGPNWKETKHKLEV